MTKFTIIIMMLLLWALGKVAYILCFEATMLGGFVPFGIIILAPIFTYFMGHHNGTEGELF